MESVYKIPICNSLHVKKKLHPSLVLERSGKHMCRFSVILQPDLIHVQLVRLLSLHTLAGSCRYATCRKEKCNCKLPFPEPCQRWLSTGEFKCE